MAGGSLTVLRIGGVPIRVHWSLGLALPYLAYTIGRQFAGVTPGHLAVGPYAWGLGLAVLLFACILLHELSHLAVGLRAGARVEDVTLMILGGVTKLSRLPDGARWEGLMAVAGPVASGLCATLFFLLDRAIPLRLHDLRFGCFYLAEINLVLALFNLIPAFPMDGGRVLRSLLTPGLGRLRATRAAATTGRIVAVGLGLFGLATGNFILALIGVFIFSSAGGEAAQLELEDLGRRFTVGQVMERHPPSLDPRATAAEVALRVRLQGTPALFVVEPDGRLLGALTAGQIQNIPAALLPLTRVTDLMRASVITTSPDRPLGEALHALVESGLPLLPVLLEGILVGALGRDVVLRLRRTPLPEGPVAALRHREA